MLIHTILLGAHIVKRLVFEMFSKFFKRTANSAATQRPLLETQNYDTDLSDYHSDSRSMQMAFDSFKASFNTQPGMGQRGCQQPPGDVTGFNQPEQSARGREMSKPQCNTRNFSNSENHLNQFMPEIDKELTQGHLNKVKLRREVRRQQVMVNTIDGLKPGIQSTPLIGLVLSKDDMKVFEAKHGSDSGPRSVLSFTLRDSAFSYINVSMWGKPESVGNLSVSFSIGDIVQVTGCNVKEKQVQDDKYRPWTPSPYQVVLNESHGSITNYEGSLLDDYVRLAHMPLQTPGPLYKLSEIVGNLKNLGNDLVSFTAAVRSVGAARSVTAKSSGRKIHLREVKLFDQQVQLFYLVLWSNEMIEFSEHWLTNETVLAAVDVKVSYDHYKKAVVASASSKSIFIINPDTKEGAALYQFAQTVSWPDDDTDKPLALQSIDLSTVRTEYNVYEFVKACEDIQPEGFEYGIVFGFLSSFDVDGSLDTVLSGKCCECGKMLSSLVSGRCTSYDCMSSDIVDLRDDDIFYSLKVEISDHTGTLTNCKLIAEEASKMLQCKAIEFAQLDDDQKTIRKWNYLFERCRFIVKAYRPADSPVTFVVLESSKLSCQEHIKHLR